MAYLKESLVQFLKNSKVYLKEITKQIIHGISGVIFWRISEEITGNISVWFLQDISDKLFEKKNLNQSVKKLLKWSLEKYIK